jgi:hypothetical protein
MKHPASHSRRLTVLLTILFNFAFGFAGHAAEQPNVTFITAAGRRDRAAYSTVCEQVEATGNAA